MKANEDLLKIPNKHIDANESTRFLNDESLEYVAVIVPSTKSTEEDSLKDSVKTKILGVFPKILEELTAPPTLCSILGFLFGATPFLKKLVIGDAAPLRVIQDSVQLLGHAKGKNGSVDHQH